MASTDIKVIIKTLTCNLVIIKLLLQKHTCSFKIYELHVPILIWTNIFIFFNLSMSTKLMFGGVL